MTRICLIELRHFARRVISCLALTSTVGCGSTTFSNQMMMDPVDLESTSARPIASYELGGVGDDTAEVVVPEEDGSATVFGSGIKSFGKTTDAYAARISPDRTLVWSRTYGGDNRDVVTNAIRLERGGYMMAGYTLSSFSSPLRSEVPPRPLVIKIDDQGQVDWALTISAFYQTFGPLVELEDGTCVLVGYSATGSDLLLAGLTPSGDMSWSASYDLRWPVAPAGAVVTSSGLIVGGIVRRPDAPAIDAPFGPGQDPWMGDIFLLAVDSSGEVIWARTYQADGVQKLYSINTMQNGDVLVAGKSIIPRGTDEMYAARLSSSGAPLWSRTFGTSSHEYGTGSIETGTSDVALAGLGQPGVGLVALVDSTGSLLTSVQLADDLSGGSSASAWNDVAQLPDDELVVAGWVNRANTRNILLSFWSPPGDSEEARTGVLDQAELPLAEVSLDVKESRSSGGWPTMRVEDSMSVQQLVVTPAAAGDD